MKRSYWLEHKGKRILFIDFAHTDLSGITEAISQAKPAIEGEPRHSVLCLVETHGTRLSVPIGQAIMSFTLHNKPFMKMTAIVGVDGLQQVILNSAIIFTKRTNLIVKKSREEALDFLVAQ